MKNPLPVRVEYAQLFIENTNEYLVNAVVSGEKHDRVLDKNKNKNCCEMEELVETHHRKLCAVLRSRVLVRVLHGLARMYAHHFFARRRGKHKQQQQQQQKRLDPFVPPRQKPYRVMPHRVTACRVQGMS